MTLKTLTLATIASATFATGSLADSYFSYADALDRTSTLELGQVRSEGAGTVAIYDFHRGRQGALLGTQNVRAGANYDVHVTVGQRPINDVIAVLTVNGQVVASQEYDIDRF